MESKFKVLGHPVHPVLVVVPLGLFIATVVFDALYFWRGGPGFAVVAFWNIAAGVIGALGLQLLYFGIDCRQMFGAGIAPGNIIDECFYFFCRPSIAGGF